jgi:hypothetical protein
MNISKRPNYDLVLYQGAAMEFTGIICRLKGSLLSIFIYSHRSIDDFNNAHLKNIRNRYKLEKAGFDYLRTINMNKPTPAS